MPRTIKVPKVVNGVPSEVEITIPDDAGGPTWGPNDKHRLLNTKLKRADGPAKATGTAIYTYDVRLPNMAHGRFVVSPHAHAQGDRRRPVRGPWRCRACWPCCRSRPAAPCGTKASPSWPIVADTVEAAEDGLRAVKVTYDVLGHVVSADAATRPRRPAGLPPGQGRPARAQGNAGQVADVMSPAPTVFEAEYRTPILHHCCLECPRRYRRLPRRRLGHRVRLHAGHVHHPR